jgi:RNA polymerase sigma-70 factor (ECF subfamily)
MRAAAPFESVERVGVAVVMGRWRKESPECREAGDELSTDLALVARAQSQSDPAAFEALFAGYWRPVLAYCAVRIGDRDAAQDVAQEVFIGVAEQLHRFSPRGNASFRAWLFAIAHNKTVDARRRRERVRDIPFPEAGVWVDPRASPEEEAVRASERAYCRELLATLQKDQREVLELRAGELTTREIAAVLRLSEANVRKLQERALATLRARMPAPGGVR